MMSGPALAGEVYYDRTGSYYNVVWINIITAVCMLAGRRSGRTGHSRTLVWKHRQRRRRYIITDSLDGQRWCCVSCDSDANLPMGGTTHHEP